jgi:hypothetical protein
MDSRGAVELLASYRPGTHLRVFAVDSLNPLTHCSVKFSYPFCPRSADPVSRMRWPSEQGRASTEDSVSSSKGSDGDAQNGY